jgi:hypothetical protein
MTRYNPLDVCPVSFKLAQDVGILKYVGLGLTSAYPIKLWNPGRKISRIYHHHRVILICFVITYLLHQTIWWNRNKHFSLICLPWQSTIRSDCVPSATNLHRKLAFRWRLCHRHCIQIGPVCGHRTKMTIGSVRNLISLLAKWSWPL